MFRLARYLLSCTNRRVLFVPLCAALFVCSGCWQAPAPTAHQTERGLVWMLPGVEGGPWSLMWAHSALRDAGVDAEIRVFDWERPFGTLENLTDYEGNRQRAGQIADTIAEYRRDHPAAAIDMVGYSGGGGLAVMTAEALPEAVRLRHVILVQPALSPDYDLVPALLRIDGKLVNYYSPYDWLILGLGTQMFGTMDRKEVASAGKDRFDLEKAVHDPMLREHVEQRGWTSHMLSTGHFGNHASILGYWWNKEYVAPYLLSPAADVEANNTASESDSG